MAIKDFKLPDLGEGLTEGEVVSWLVEVGDVIELDQNVVEIETAKAVVEVPSPYAGTVVTLHGQPGEEVQVGAPLITIDVGGEDDVAGDEAAGSQAGDAPAPSQAAFEVGQDEVAETADEAADAAEEGSGSVLVGYGTSSGGGSRRRRPGGGGAPAGEGGAAAGGGGGAAGDGGASAGGAAVNGAGGNGTATVQRTGKPLAKPPVRKMAKDMGVDLAAVPGTGPDGIITRADVQAFAEGRAPAAAAAGDQPVGAGEPAAAARQVPTPEPVAIPAAPEGGLAQQRVPLGQMRKAIATQMSRSRREIPEAVTWVEADATPLWEFRQQLNDSQAGRPDGVKVSALAIIMRMVVAGLRAFPTLNASLDTTTEEMVLHRHVNLGFAAQTDRGLLVPVIKGAHDMNILQLAAALNELAQTARAGKLQPSDMSGGTFTVSNYGAFGVDGGDMVINHPEAAILGTGRISDKPWVVDGQLAVRKVITYAIAFDHRLIDGGEGAGFIRHLADMTENPTLLTAQL